MISEKDTLGSENKYPEILIIHSVVIRNYFFNMKRSFTISCTINLFQETFCRMIFINYICHSIRGVAQPG